MQVVVRAHTLSSQQFTLGNSALAFLEEILQKAPPLMDIKPDIKLQDTTQNLRSANKHILIRESQCA